MNTAYVILVLLILILSYGVVIFNSLVKLRNLKEEAWSGIDVQLKRRHDLLPNLVETVKGYASHEQSTLEEVTRLRSQSEASNDVKEIGEIERNISKDIKKIFALVEDYPDLKANEGFLKLQENLSEIEDQLQFARRYYNGTIRNYKIKLQSFPSSIVAGIASFKDAEFFEIEYATERSTPELDL